MLKKDDNILFFILLSLSLIFLSINSPGKKNIVKIKGVVSYVYRETSAFFSNIILNIGDYIKANKIHKKTFYENIELRKEIIRLQHENIYLKNFILEKGLNFKNKIKNTIIAKIVAWDMEDPYKSFFINKGSKDKITVNSPVLDESGNLIGKIVEPISRHTSTVLLISNPEFGVGVKIGEKNVLGTLFGNGSDKGIIKYIRLTTKIKKGDIVYTSGLDMTFPEGIKIGKIIDIKKGYYAIEAITELSALKHTPRYIGIIKNEKNN